MRFQAPATTYAAPAVVATQTGSSALTEIGREAKRKRQISQFGWLLGSSVEHHSSQFRGPIHGVAANGLLFGATDNQPSNRSSARWLAANDSS